LSNAAAFSGISINFAATGISINSHTTGITIQSTGGGASHNNMQPFSVGTWYIKL
jgi:microcystin-dependent protein